MVPATVFIMNVAVGIDIQAGGPAPVDEVRAGSAKLGVSGSSLAACGSVNSRSSDTRTGGFRTSWQLQLASLGVNQGDASKTVTSSSVAPVQRGMPQKGSNTPEARPKVNLPKGLYTKIFASAQGAQSQQEAAAEVAEGDKSSGPLRNSLNKPQEAAHKKNHKAQSAANAEASGATALAMATFPLPITAPVSIPVAKAPGKPLLSAQSSTAPESAAGETASKFAILAALAAASQPKSTANTGAKVKLTMAVDTNSAAEGGIAVRAQDNISEISGESEVPDAKMQGKSTFAAGQSQANGPAAEVAPAAQTRQKGNAASGPDGSRKSSASAEQQMQGLAPAVQSPRLSQNAQATAPIAPEAPLAAKASDSGTKSGAATAKAAFHAEDAMAGMVVGHEKDRAGTQQHKTGVSAAALAHDLTGARGTAITAVVHGGRAQNTSSAASGQATFTALDAGMNANAPNWVHTGAQRAEAGFQDPSLGWVGVRANVSGGSIHAALVPGSPDAAQALAGHLAGLNAHLAAQHTAVQTVTVAAPNTRGNGWNSGQGANQGSQQGSHQGSYQGSGQNPQQDGSAHSQSSTVPGRGSASVVRTAIAAHSSAAAAATRGADNGGAYISVVA